MEHKSGQFPRATRLGCFCGVLRSLHGRSLHLRCHRRIFGILDMAHVSRNFAEALGARHTVIAIGHLELPVASMLHSHIRAVTKVPYSDGRMFYSNGHGFGRGVASRGVEYGVDRVSMTEYLLNVSRSWYFYYSSFTPILSSLSSSIEPRLVPCCIRDSENFFSSSSLIDVVSSATWHRTTRIWPPSMSQTLFKLISYPC